MHRRACFATIAVICLGVGVWLGGCPSSTNTGADGTGGTGTNTDADNAAPTAAERAAAAVAAKSAQSLAQAVNAAQSPTAAEDNAQASYDIPAIDPMMEFGTCPQVGLQLSMAGLLMFDMTVDFGAGCQPFGSAEYTCSGAASGTFDQSEKRMQMTFNNLSCNDVQLGGTINVLYERTTTAVSLEGAFDLSYQDAVGPIQTTGAGNGSYDLEQYVTTVANFAGTATGDAEYGVTMTNLLMSFAQYGHFMPYGGEITVLGDTIRQCVVRFDENSPTTGVVQVSIAGLPFVPVNLYGVE